MGDHDSVDEVTPPSVSAYFDKTYKLYLDLIRGEEDTNSESVQKKITDAIKSLEDLTRQVSVLGILSENENYKEMNPSELKFIMLPYLIGNLWQLSRNETRENVCHMSKVYFRDFLKRCKNYEIIGKLPPEALPEDEDDDAEEGKKSRPPPKANSDDVRAIKIQRFKEAKLLDEKINRYLHSHLNKGHLDDEDLSTLVVSLLKRNAMDAEDQLRSIAQELELIQYAEKMKIGTKNNSSGEAPMASCSSHHSHSHGKKDKPKKPPQIFILTKTDVEKQVYGAGYPAIPVMTVEELYEQRRRTGQWGPPSSKLPPPTETDDDRDEQREELEDEDDEELRARQQRMDDYKDDHRRGWGNRYNRS